MIHYEDFEKEALQLVGNVGNDWKHVLPAIPLAFRNRFITTLEHGFNMPESFDMVMLCQKLKEEEYDLFLQKAIEKKDTKRNKGEHKLST